MIPQMLEDLEEALAAAETEAHMAAEEVARASRRPAGKPEAAAAAGGTDERLARLQKKAKRAADRVAELRLVIEGPPQLQVAPPLFSRQAEWGFLWLGQGPA